jgi:hypothetical protein
MSPNLVLNGTCGGLNGTPLIGGVRLVAGILRAQCGDLHDRLRDGQFMAVNRLSTLSAWTSITIGP